MAVSVNFPVSTSTVYLRGQTTYRVNGYQSDLAFAAHRAWLIPKNPSGAIPRIEGDVTVPVNGHFSVDFDGIVPGETYHLLIAGDAGDSDLAFDILFNAGNPPVLQVAAAAGSGRGARSRG